MSIAEKLTTVAENVPKVYGAGIQAERDSLWGTLQNSAHRNFLYAFAYERFNDATFNPIQDFIASSNTNSFQNMFYNNAAITDTKVGFDARKTSHIGAMFYNAKNLKEIRKIIIGSNVVSGGNNAFTGCKNLKKICFEGEICLSLNMKDCSGLSRVSLENIVNHLSDNTNDLTLTLSQTAIDNAFETSDGAGDGSASVEWAELIADKTNWTISLL